MENWLLICAYLILVYQKFLQGYSAIRSIATSRISGLYLSLVDISTLRWRRVIYNQPREFLLNLAASSSHRATTFSVVYPFLIGVEVVAILGFDPFDILRDAVSWVVNSLVAGIMNAISNLFIIGAEKFMFFTNPSEIPALDAVFYRTLAISIPLLFLLTLGFFGVAMFFPSRTETDPYRMFERIIYAVIGIIIARPVIALVVTVTHMFSIFLYPEEYSLVWGPQLIEGMFGGLGTIFAALILAVFGGLSILVSGLFFYGVLIFRELLVYMVFGLSPLLGVFWVFDAGIGKYTHAAAKYLITLTALFLIFGILISGILSVGAGVAGFTGDENPTESDPIDVGQGGELGEFGLIFFKLFAYMGTLWLVIGLATSVFKLAKKIGIGGGGLPGRRIRKQRSPGTATGAASSGGGGGTIANGGQQPAVVFGETSKGPLQVETLNNGDLILSNGGQDGVVFRSDPGLGRVASTFSGGDIGQALSTGDQLEDVSIDDISGMGDDAKIDESDMSMSLREKATQPRDMLGNTFQAIGSTAEDQGFNKIGRGLDRLGGGIKKYATKEGAAAAGYYGATVGGRLAVDEDSGRIHSTLGGAVGTLTRTGQGIGRAVKGGTVTYGRMFAEEDPVRSAQIGLNAMRRSPIGDPRRSNVTGEITETTPDTVGGVGLASSGTISSRSEATTSSKSADKVKLSDETSEARYGEIGAPSTLPEPEWNGQTDGCGRNGWRTVEAYGGPIIPGDQVRYNTRGSEWIDGPGAGTIHETQLDEFGTIKPPYVVRPGGESSSKRGIVMENDIVAVRTQGTFVDDLSSEIDSEAVERDMEASGISGVSQEAFVGGDASTNPNITPDTIDQALQHQMNMGVESDEALARVRRVINYEGFDPVGEFGIDDEIVAATGIPEIPEHLETDSAASRISIADDPAETSGIHAKRMWRYEFADQAQTVYGQDVSGYDYGVQTLAAEESLSQMGVNTPSYHYDPNKDFVRAEGIAGEDIGDIQKASETSPEKASEKLAIDPNEIDENSYTNAIAGMALAGNHDLNPGNIRFNEEGKAHLIDNDETGLEQLTETKVERLSEKGAEYADDMGLSVDQKEISDSINMMANDVNVESFRAETSESVIQRIGEGSERQERSSADSIMSPIKAFEKHNRAQETVNLISANIEKVQNDNLPSGRRESVEGTGPSLENEDANEDVAAVAEEISLDAQEIENRITLLTQLEGMSRSEAISDIQDEN